MNLIQKQRIKFTVSVTLVSALVLLAVLGGMFGLVYAINFAYLQNNCDKALQSPVNYNMTAPPDMQCLFVFEKDDEIRIGENPIIHSSNIDEVVRLAINTKEGKFDVGDNNYYVKCATHNGGTLYAVFDRTSAHEQFVNTALVVSLLYVLSIILVILLAILSSAKLLYPVTLALKKQRDFVANTSHELKTPLTVISTNLDVIKSEPHSTVEENEKWISSIETQVERMQDLITNMLELSKLEQSELKKEKLNFSSLTEGACLSLEAVCFEKNVELITDLQPEILLEGEEKSLDRLVIILLDNAIKYCGENGKVGLRLRCDQKKAYLSVMNTGQSISQEDALHVFDRFYRADGARENDDNHSFGLGLSIAEATVKAHDGTITCHGVEEKGTVFDITLPLQAKKKKRLFEKLN